MLTVMLGLGLLCAFLSVVLFVSGPSGGGARQREASAPLREVPEGAPAVVKVFFPLINALSGPAKAIRWPSYRDRASVAIARSGWGDSFTVNHLFALKILSALVLPLTAALLFAPVRNPAIFLLAAVGAFFAPDQMLSSSRKARERQIVRTLPGAVDVLSLSVEAGLEFLIALERLVKRGLSGPLRDELTAVLNDIRLGTTRSEALRAMATRLEIPQVGSFVSTLDTGGPARRLNRRSPEITGRFPADRAVPAGGEGGRAGDAEDHLPDAAVHLPGGVAGGDRTNRPEVHLLGFLRLIRAHPPPDRRDARGRP